MLYFFFSVSHFVIQISFQIRAYTINADAHQILSKIVHDAGTVNKSVPFLRGSHLHLCSWIPANLNTDVASCPIIWDGDVESDLTMNNGVGSAAAVPTPSAPRFSVTIVPTSTATSDPIDREYGQYDRRVCATCLVETSTTDWPNRKLSNGTSTLYPPQPESQPW